ncbi:hypothetical protein ABKV19_006313 [Rosa sericea]
MEKKKVVVDHYRVLGLPSGEEGSKLNKKEITKAYRAKALQLHPDKRPNDPNAKVKFQKLNSSYEILMDPKARKQFDSSIRLDNKSSPQPEKKACKPKERASEPKKMASKRNWDDDEVIMYGFFIIVLAPMVFPAARSQTFIAIRSLFFLFATDEICLRKDSVHSMLVRVGNFFKHKPSEAANNQESQGDDHEDIEDWVIDACTYGEGNTHVIEASKDGLKSQLEKISFFGFIW